jgi:hypothetical protein
MKNFLTLVNKTQEKKNKTMSFGPQSASATSLNFQGFEEMAGFGTPSLLYGRIFIEPDMPRAAGRNAIAATKPPPGQFPYLRARRTLWNKSSVARQLERQGFKPSSYRSY